MICLCATTVWVWRSSEDSLRRRFLNSAPVVWALLVAGTIAVAQVRGYLFPYVVLWRSVIVILRRFLWDRNFLVERILLLEQHVHLSYQ